MFWVWSSSSLSGGPSSSSSSSGPAVSVINRICSYYCFTMTVSWMMVMILVSSSCLLQRSESFVPIPTTTILSSRHHSPGIQHNHGHDSHFDNVICSSNRYSVRRGALSSVKQQSTNEEEKQLTTKKKLRSWEESFQLLVSYKEQHGNCNVPTKYKEDPRLGLWVKAQRRRKDRLSDERIAKLDDLGFSWSNELRDQQWEEMFEKLQKYNEMYGNCNVPTEYKDDPRLGYWVKNQRKRKDSIRNERIAKLDDLGFSWPNELRDQQWEEMFEKLQKYNEMHGTCNVPRNYKNDDSRLAIWVHSQRDRRRDDKLNEERIAKLEGLGFSWSNEIREEQWEEMFQKLVQYAKENNGDCNIPWNADNDVNRPLQKWVKEQRMRKSLLSKERRTKLDKLGLIWEDANKVKADQKWNGMYDRLKEYKRKNGHCRVPQKWEDDPALGLWVFNQRQDYRKGLLRIDRQMKLEEMSFTWKARDTVAGPDVSKLDLKWLVKFGKLLNFLEEHGHCDVPYHYKKDKSLAKWVYTQRRNQKMGSLRLDRKKYLDDIGVTWSFDDQIDEQWNEKYKALKTFKEANGHLRLPETSASLSNWVSRQRVFFATGKMDPKKKSLLDEMEFRWEIETRSLKR